MLHASLALIAKGTKWIGGGKGFQLTEAKAKFIDCHEVHFESCSQTTEC